MTLRTQAGFVLVGMALAIWPAWATADATPVEVTASYRILKSGLLIGTVEEKFTRTDDNYKITSDTRTAGGLRLMYGGEIFVSAEGKIGAAGLEPAIYEFRRQGNGAKNISARFDWNVHQIFSQQSSRSESFELPAGTMDRISAMYQFMFNAPRENRVHTWVSNGKQAELYHYRKRGEPTMQVGSQLLATVHYERESEPGRPRAQLWLAKDHHYLPVRAIFEDSRGLSLEQTLVQFQVR